VLAHALTISLVASSTQRWRRAPRPPLTPAVLPDLPFALAIDFDAGRVHDHVPYLPQFFERQRDRQAAAPARERRVIGHGQVEPQQLEDRGEEALGLPSGERVNGLDGGHRLNGQVGVLIRSPALAGLLFVAPVAADVISDPDGQASPASERGVILLPVADEVRGFFS